MTKTSAKYSRDDWEQSRNSPEDFILRIIESEDITVEVEKETDEEIAKVRFL